MQNMLFHQIDKKNVLFIQDHAVAVTLEAALTGYHEHDMISGMDMVMAHMVS